jgi:hypothetical protein
MTKPSTPANRARDTRDLTDEFIVDPLPTAVLHYLVADLPGPRGETGIARAARFDAQLAEVLSYNPRNAAEAMLAAHCILLRVVAEDARGDASRAGADAAMVKQHVRSARQLDKLLVNMQRTLADFQHRPLGTPGPASFAAPSPGPRPMPDPARTTPAWSAEEAFSAVIVPLRPASETVH